MGHGSRWSGLQMSVPNRFSRGMPTFPMRASFAPYEAGAVFAESPRGIVRAALTVGSDCRFAEPFPLFLEIFGDESPA